MEKATVDRLIWSSMASSTLVLSLDGSLGQSHANATWFSTWLGYDCMPWPTISRPFQEVAESCPHCCQLYDGQNTHHCHWACHGHSLFDEHNQTVWRRQVGSLVECARSRRHEISCTWQDANILPTLSRVTIDAFTRQQYNLPCTLSIDWYYFEGFVYRFISLDAWCSSIDYLSVWMDSHGLDCLFLPSVCESRVFSGQHRLSHYPLGRTHDNPQIDLTFLTSSIASMDQQSSSRRSIFATLPRSFISRAAQEFAQLSCLFNNGYVCTNACQAVESIFTE